MFWSRNSSYFGWSKIDRIPRYQAEIVIRKRIDRAYFAWNSRQFVRNSRGTYCW